MEGGEAHQSSGSLQSASAKPLPLRSYGSLGRLAAGSFSTVVTCDAERTGTSPHTSGSLSPATAPSPSSRAFSSTTRTFRPNVNFRQPGVSRPSPYASRAPSPKRGQDFTGKGAAGADLGILLAQSLKMKNDEAQRDRRGRGVTDGRLGGGKGSTAPFQKPLSSAAPMKSEEGVAGAALPSAVGYYQSKATIIARNMKLAKSAEGKRSKTLLELPWSNSLDPNAYNPISLPFVLREQEPPNAAFSSTASSGAGASASFSKRPTAKHVDEVNRNAAVLFQSSDAASDEEVDRWYLVQMPALLPGLAKRKHTKDAGGAKSVSSTKASASTKFSPTTPADDSTYGCSSLYGLPSGYLGKLAIHRSGKVKLIMSNYQFDVNLGSECNFAQEVACHDLRENKLIFAGGCPRRMVVTPNVHFLLKFATSREQKKTGCPDSDEDDCKAD